MTEFQVDVLKWIGVYAILWPIFPVIVSLSFLVPSFKVAIKHKLKR